MAQKLLPNSERFGLRDANNSESHYDACRLPHGQRFRTDFAVLCMFCHWQRVEKAVDSTKHMACRVADRVVVEKSPLRVRAEAQAITFLEGRESILTDQQLASFASSWDQTTLLCRVIKPPLILPRVLDPKDPDLRQCFADHRTSRSSPGRG